MYNEWVVPMYPIYQYVRGVTATSVRRLWEILRLTVSTKDFIQSPLYNPCTGLFKM